MKAINYLLFLMLAVSCPPQVLAGCTLAATPVAFGSYSPLASLPLTSNGSASIACDIGPILYTLTMNTGSSGNFSARTMTFSTYKLQYNLHTDLANTLVWGDGTAGTTYPSSLVLSVLCTALTPCVYTIYGLIPAGQTNVAAGTYTDTITLTLTY